MSRLNLCRLWRRLVTLVLYKWRFQDAGRGLVIYSPTMLCGLRYVSVGRGVTIRHGVRIEAIPVRGRRPHISIGANTNIEQDVHIVSSKRVMIGANVSITARCAIVDVSHGTGGGLAKIGDHIEDDAKEVTISDGCFLGIGAVILPGVSLGAGCIVGANAVVTHSFPPRTIIAGVPARAVRTY